MKYYEQYVSIDDQCEGCTIPSRISNSPNFSATVPLPTGTNVVSVVAQPLTGEIPTTTQRVQVVTTGTAPAALTYDANGNTLTDESGNGYTWDALNRLISITYPSGASSTFAYDGLSRRVQMVEKDASNAVTSTKNYLWVGSAMAEERDVSNVVTKRFFPQGEQQAGTNYYYTRDHLGSVREMTDGNDTIQARYGYDPYGRTTLVLGSDIATFQYAELMKHQPSGLLLTANYPGISGREYDTGTGRWLNRDAIGESGGLNLYGYVGNNPLSFNDPTGMVPAGTPPIAITNDGVSQSDYDSVIAALNQFLKTKPGQAALAQLRKESTPQLIIEVSAVYPNSSYWPQGANPYTGIYQQPMVRINPCKAQRAMTVNGMEAAPLAAIIAHEFAHAVIGLPGYNGDPVNDAEEQAAKSFENEVRKELGLPQRL